MTKKYMLIHEFNRTGVPTAAVNLIRGLNDDIKLVVIGEVVATNDIDVDFLGVKRGSGLVGKIRYLIQSYIGLLRYVRKNKVKSLLVWGKEFTLVSILVRPLTGNFRIIGVMVTDTEQHLKTKRFAGLILKVYRMLLSRAELISQSAGIAKGLNSMGLQSTVCFPIVRKEFFETKTAQAKKKIVFVGSMTENKQPHYALDIIKDNKDYTLHYIGDGELRAELEKKAAELNISDRVVFEGTSDNVIPLIKDASLLLLTSKFEGFGMVLVEAAAIGVPVVSFDCPSGPKEIIKDGINGYLVAPNDLIDLEIKTKYALSRKWDKESVKASVKQFHPDDIISRYKEIWDAKLEARESTKQED